ncbi:STAS domain-containing protein [Candidatus Formimonas warabiya]|uniref:Anti-sigma factor antagonist n=1 Tax=Formimonas warabiya TaxID=1761012 RepID=A0A3G1KZL2_FORW1|nr:STAS domain-containing protein [Candidatus Formimonas warabiya]ATW27838.1 anti-anti-sigma factor [Candidatus Formimonas warabiya]
MEITIQNENGYLVVKAVGRLDTNTAAQFEQECAPCLTGTANKTVLDFSKLEYISSAGLRCILSMAKKLKAGGGSLVLCGLNGLVEEVIRISGFDSFLPIFADVACAIKEN